jgi:hypothetical protein
MNDKMLPPNDRPMPFSTSKSSRNTKVARERTLRISYGGIVFVWENGFGMQTGNWSRKNMQGNVDEKS